MSTRGESISFCATSIGRNSFIQVATGLFGGDPSWGVGAYMPTSASYRDSLSYRSTVATADGAFQRAPTACWYAMGNATITSLKTTAKGTELRLSWNVAPALWNNVRIPGQCFSFCDAGVLIHGVITANSTDSEAVVTVDGSLTSLQQGDVLWYMIRPRPPRMVIQGPVEVSKDGRSIMVQGNPKESGFVPPATSTHLLYIGRRGTNPLQLCQMDTDPERARQWIFSVEDVAFEGADPLKPVYALQSQLLTGGSGTWNQLTPWLLVGCIPAGGEFLLSGMHYTWPYPKDQVGKAWMIVPTNGGVVGVPVCPGAVYFVRAATIKVPNGSVADGVNLQDGDRILVAENDQWSVAEWSSTSSYYSKVEDVFPPHVLVVVEAGGQKMGSTAWWMGDDLKWNPYTVIASVDHTKGVEAFMSSSVTWKTTSNHAFVILSRRADGLYAAIPAAVSSNLSNLNPVGWNWTYPLSLLDGADRFNGASATDGLLGLPRSLNPTPDIDSACIRRRVGPRLTTDTRPPEYIRLNMDMGGPVVLKAIAWAMVMDGTYPTITLHGSNDHAFFSDQVVDIPMNERISAPSYSQNQHHLDHGANLLWQLCVDREGSSWTEAELLAGTADIYITRFSSDPRYTRTYSNGQINGPIRYNQWAAAHRFPDKPTTYTAYRYYALTVSVGMLTASSSRTIEIQEFQPLVDAPKAALSVSAELFGRGTIPSGSGKYTIRLNRVLPTTFLGQVSPELGYVEVWDSFKIRTAYHQGQAWSTTSFPSQPGTMPGRGRRASLSLAEVLLPRFATIRSINMTITALPYIWCFIRHRAIQAVGDQSTIVNRLIDVERVLEAFLQPPAWILGRDTIWFQLTIPSARIPADTQYIGLASSNVVQVTVTDTIGSALPEFCLVIPSGEMLDFIQYNANIPLPDEVAQDDWSGISAMLTVQFDEPQVKRQRTLLSS